jgi:hypothetical protein
VKRTADVKVDPKTVLHKVGYGGFQEWFELEEASVD